MNICSKLVPVFCFDWSSQLRYDYDYTGECVYAGCQMIVYKFYCQWEEVYKLVAFYKVVFYNGKITWKHYECFSKESQD